MRTKRHLAGLAGLVLGGLLSACATPARAPETTDASAIVAEDWPASTTRIATTAGDLYLGNLDARIEALASAIEASALPQRQVSLAASLYHRHRVRGDDADAERALRILDEVIAATPASVPALSLRAVIRAGYHEFDAARADLEAAHAAGARLADQVHIRREIALAVGDYPPLSVDFANSADDSEDFHTLALRGNLRVLLGDLEGASRQFRRAQATYRDSSPVPLAWLHVQQGIALLRHGRMAEANRFFRAAHERLPGYTLATEHLAETEAALGHLDEARRLYAIAIADTGHPEYLAALSGVEAAAGDAQRAAGLRSEAERSWRVRLARHPRAHAQHAIEFFLDTGAVGDAMALSRDNLAVRRDIGSLILHARAAAAAGDTVAACQARAEADATGMHPPEWSELAALDLDCRNEG